MSNTAVNPALPEIDGPRPFVFNHGYIKGVVVGRPAEPTSEGVNMVVDVAWTISVRGVKLGERIALRVPADTAAGAEVGHILEIARRRPGHPAGQLDAMTYPPGT